MDEASAIVEDFRWLPFRLDARGDNIIFIHADRDAHRAVTFLDDSLVRQGGENRQVELEKLASRVATLPVGDCHFLFHSAFCCSTLLARALDVPGKAMALKEPLILNDIVQVALGAGRADAVRGPLGLSLALLGRPFGRGEAVVIKPSNVVNPLIGEMLELRPTAKALFLSSALPEFLRSVAKKGLWGRIWARKQLPAFERLQQLQAGFTESDRWEHSDLQVAALVWLHQRAQFAAMLAHLPVGRAASLDSSTLLDDTAATLRAVSAFYGLGLSDQEAGEIANGPVFSSDSKRHDEAYSADRRRAEHDAIGGVLAEEIDMVVKWAESVGDHLGIPRELPRPLLG